jgi:hypothetical protein
MDKPDIIKKAMQTEMDRRLDLMRQYLLMQEKMTPLYTHPPRTPLTRERAIALWADKSDGPSNSEIVSYCRAIEAAHGIGKAVTP